MKKLAFVIPWFGADIPGGAEMELRELTKKLNEADIPLEILTTCVKEFNSDWNDNYYPEGVEYINNILVRRFKVKKGDSKLFHEVNYKFMNNLPVSREEENTFLNEMINSNDLYEYMNKNKDEYSLFIFIPYMFSTTYFGVQICPEKSILIPCLHDENYAYMENFKEVYSKVKGMIFNAEPEYLLADKIFNLSEVIVNVMGIGLDTNINSYPDKFVNKYNIKNPFILYAGRKDSGKNINTLLSYFNEYKKRNENDIKLVLIGGGEIKIPDEIKNEVIDLGFVPMQDKYNAYGAATLLCQPSINESFSYVIMESWLCRRPVLVHEQCEVTKYFAKESNGGLYFSNYFEFESCINYFLEHKEETNTMGENGKKFVENNFSWDIIVDRYTNFFEKVIADE